MRIAVLGADGYLGWPTCMKLASEGHTVLAVDNLIKRQWERYCEVQPLWNIPYASQRVETWNKNESSRIYYVYIDVALDYEHLCNALQEFNIDTIIHYAEQPSAPFSHMNRRKCLETQTNNIVGTLNLIWAVREVDPSIHIIKLGTMGEYGTPDIDIEEGWLDVEHKGRSDRMLYPKKPGSWYHASKVHDSHNLEFACRAWGLRVTDLNQGIVYGAHTSQTWLRPEYNTSFHYDAIFGTVINRFLCQAAVGYPLTVYGDGSQTRGYLNIIDTLECVTLAAETPAEVGEFRVFNQSTEQFSVLQLADRIADMTKTKRLHIDNPRIEQLGHYYKAANSALPALGLKPTLLTDKRLEQMYKVIRPHIGGINPDLFKPKIRW